MFKFLNILKKGDTGNEKERINHRGHQVGSATNLLHDLRRKGTTLLQ